jgi:hypothetical protein
MLDKCGVHVEAERATQKSDINIQRRLLKAGPFFSKIRAGQCFYPHFIAL